MIHLPHHVRLVCLSATVSNSTSCRPDRRPCAGRRRRSSTARPVRLDNEYLSRTRRTTDYGCSAFHRRTPESGRRAARRVSGAWTIRPGGGHPQSDRRGNPRGRSDDDRGSGRKVLAPPGRVETVDHQAAAAKHAGQVQLGGRAVLGPDRAGSHYAPPLSLAATHDPCTLSAGPSRSVMSSAAGSPPFARYSASILGGGLLSRAASECTRCPRRRRSRGPSVGDPCPCSIADMEERMPGW